MFCKNCGNQILDGSPVCPFCGFHAGGNQGGPYSGNGYGNGMAPKRIDNIFSALIYQRTPGVIMEFSLWCTVCFVVLMSLIAVILGDGNVTWIMLMVFSIGLGVLQAFRLKPIAMLYSVSVFHLITFIIHYACFAKSASLGIGISYSPLNIILFVLTLLLAIGVVTCSAIQFFTRLNLANILTILVLADSGLMLILHILMYAASHLGQSAFRINEAVREYLNYGGYWIGTICFWLILSVVCLLYVFFFWGSMDSTKDKIISLSPVPHSWSGKTGIRGVSGMYTGQVIYLQGNMLTIGSGAGVMVRIPDSHVSGQHCAIRFNSSTGYYEVFDNSQNGVYIRNGGSLQKGKYNYVPRGSVLCIGGMTHQFQLI